MWGWLDPWLVDGLMYIGLMNILFLWTVLSCSVSFASVIFGCVVNVLWLGRSRTWLDDSWLATLDGEGGR